MNDTHGKSDLPNGSEVVAKAVRLAVADTETAYPAADVEATGEALAGEPGANAGAKVQSLVDPAVVAKTLGTLARMVERFAARGLSQVAFRASGGDRQFAQSVADEWQWSNEDWTGVDDLLAQVVRQWALQDYVRPDVALLVATGGHLVGYLTLSQRLAKVAAETEKLAKDKASASNS